MENLEPPRFENIGPVLIAGLTEHFTADTAAHIPELWKRFEPHMGHIPGQIGGRTSYGVIANGDSGGGMDYTCGVEVGTPGEIAAPLNRVEIPGGRYAVFTHRGHISGIRQTFDAIWNDWAPRNKVGRGPSFEKYGPAFNPFTGNGGFEIWVPVVS